jgi:hypothetical protein
MPDRKMSPLKTQSTYFAVSVLGKRNLPFEASFFRPLRLGRPFCFQGKEVREMEKEWSYQRTFREIMDDFPWGDVRDLDSANGRRDWALKEVLRIVPAEDYQILKKCLGQYKLFRPPKANLGNVDTLSGFSLILYLDPLLEEEEDIDFDRVLVVAAHEIAHIVLKQDYNPEMEKYWQQEFDAWKRICEWGFGKEVKKHLTFQKKGYRVTAKFEPRSLPVELERLLNDELNSSIDVNDKNGIGS